MQCTAELEPGRRVNILGRAGSRVSVQVFKRRDLESENHFLTARKVTREDRANLSSLTVEASVLVAQALKKDIISLEQ